MNLRESASTSRASFILTREGNRFQDLEEEEEGGGEERNAFSYFSQLKTFFKDRCVHVLSRWNLEGDC